MHTVATGIMLVSQNICHVVMLHNIRQVERWLTQRFKLSGSKFAPQGVSLHVDLRKLPYLSYKDTAPSLGKHIAKNSESERSHTNASITQSVMKHEELNS